ncbi:ATPase, partial [Candidatus Falkowbacteria bacterium]
EGLILSVTFILALGMQQILKKKALTRKLIAAETLGSITVICSDKTGTLTEGNMHVAHIVIGKKEFELKSLGSRQNEKEAKTVSLALQTAMMCNDSLIENPNDELASWRFLGSPTENALLSAAIQSGLSREKLLKLEPQFGEMPFDSEKKYMLSLHKRSGSEFVLYEKGAPEKLLEKSNKFYHQGAIHGLNLKDKDKLISINENLTRQGLRVVAMATREINTKKFRGIIEEGKIDWEEIDKKLTFVGFIALKDPLRPEAKETINLCKKAGIRPILITGDHKLTAKAIGEEVGLKVKAENIIDGERLNKVNDEELKKLVKKIDIYARVSPHHKLRIVKALQARGEVVAMTGDGINDSPALKAADIGISLGTGTDIAKETSDIVLLDNNFKTIVAAVKQGRIIFKNIRKVITYLTSDGFSEMILIVGSLLFNTPLAILPVQILWINIINDGLPHFSLAFEGDHGRVMSEKPIKKNEPLLNREMKIIIFAVGIIRDIIIFLGFYLLWLKWRESSELVSYLITLVFVTLGLKSLMSIFSLRSFKIPIWRLNPFENLYLIGAVTASFLLLISGVYWQPLQKLLNTTSLDIKAWAIAFFIGLLNIVFLEIVKTKFRTEDKYV